MIPIVTIPTNASMAVATWSCLRIGSRRPPIRRATTSIPAGAETAAIAPSATAGTTASDIGRPQSREMTNASSPATTNAVANASRNASRYDSPGILTSAAR